MTPCTSAAATISRPERKPLQLWWRVAHGAASALMGVGLSLLISVVVGRWGPLAGVLTAIPAFSVAVVFVVAVRLYVEHVLPPEPK